MTGAALCDVRRLCVDMKKGRVLKEGLIQYRIVCLAVNVASLEDVIKHLLKLAHDRAETAQAQSASHVVEVRAHKEALLTTTRRPRASPKPRCPRPAARTPHALLLSAQPPPWI